VETTSRPVENIRLSLYDVANKLFTLCHLEGEPEEDAIVTKILELDDMKMVYDTQSHKLIDIELIEI
jgi:molybdenum cofactor biosynthesis enzyme MoaA